MSIHFISGKPGGGKTLYSVRLIIDELVSSNRTVITNVPLLLPRLNEFLQQQYPKQFADRFCNNGMASGKLVAHHVRQMQFHSLHITDRVILIDEDDLPKFFTFRPGNVRLASVSNAEWKAGKRPDFSGVKDAGVLYVLDEVHIAFNARAWAETGHEVLYYLSQHRKLGDDVICITQAIGNVDKQFRSVAQDFTYIKNLSKQKAGIFRLPAIFTRNTYAQPATDNSKPMETGSFTMDVTGIASCYDTAKGVGIHGRAGADTNSRKKGVHWLWFLIGCPLLLWLFIHYVPLIVAKVTTPKMPVHHSTSPKPSDTLPAPEGNQDSKPVLPSESPEHRKVSEQLAVTNEVYCVGYDFFDDGKPTVYLSDGSVATVPEVQLVAKRFVVVSGRKLVIRPGQAHTDYVPLPPSSDYFEPVPRPVNQADVTVIGQHYQDRKPPSRGSGFERMAGK